MTIVAEDNNVAVFPFKLYDISKDEYIVSRRLATAAAIDRIGATIAGPHFAIPHHDVGEDGFTAVGYDGYEKRVK